MSTSEDRRITGKITLATIGRTIHPVPPPPPPAQRQAVPVPPPAAPRAKAAAPTPQPTKPAATPAARATAPSKVAQQPSVTEEDRRIDARIAALAAARTLLPEVFNDDDPPPLPEDVNKRLIAAGIPAKAAQDALEWWAATPAYRAARRRRERAQDDLRIEIRMANLALLRELAPKVFDPDTPIPLAIGANNQLIELGIAKQAVGGILSWWCGRPEYRAALARGGNRHNIDGSIHGPISTDDQQHAADQISRARERARGGL